MAALLDINAFLAQNTLPMLDVRAPMEYQEGHIPGAISFPLFSDAERHEVGLYYKQKGQLEAILLGLGFTGPKLESFARKALELAPKGEVRVYCWRGGMRSASMAWLLEQVGLKVHRLEGGYKAFRRHVLGNLQFPSHGIVLGGKTGSRKTDALHELIKLGEQVIDLEALANHKGSAFGLAEGEAQPKMEHFENELWQVLQGLDENRRVWVEDESKKIGTIFIRPEFYSGLEAAPLVVINKSAEERAALLAVEYGKQSKERLKLGFERIARRLGGQHHQRALGLLEDGKLEDAALIALKYYDKTYAYGLENRKSISVHHLDTEGLNPNQMALQLIEMANNIYGAESN